MKLSSMITWANFGMAVLVCLASLTLLRWCENALYFLEEDSCLDRGGGIIDGELCVIDKGVYPLKCKGEECGISPYPEVIAKCLKTGGNVGRDGCYRKEHSYGIRCKGISCYATRRFEP